jgi:hypothetical protein
MDTGDEPQTPRLYAALPDRTEDTSTQYERCLLDLIDVLGVQRPVSASETERWQWEHEARRVIAQAVQSSPAQEGWFEPLVRAAVYDPNPSFNRQLIEPALAVFGRRRVQLALLDHLRTGSDVERAGAARAWYWTQVDLTFLGLSRTPTPESKAEFDAYADLRQEWRQTALHVFLTNEDLDVRRCILPGLDLRESHYPEELHEMVREAIRIARTHPDEYLRHRVEHQVLSLLPAGQGSSSGSGSGSSGSSICSGSTM